MYSLQTTKQFEKDYKTCRKRGVDLSLINDVIVLLEQAGKLPVKYKSHKLSGNYSGFWECHIKGDWLLIWAQDDEQQTITLVRTGTHSDLF